MKHSLEVIEEEIDILQVLCLDTDTHTRFATLQLQCVDVCHSPQYGSVTGHNQAGWNPGAGLGNG